MTLKDLPVGTLIRVNGGIVTYYHKEESGDWKRRGYWVYDYLVSSEALESGLSKIDILGPMIGN